MAIMGSSPLVSDTYLDELAARAETLYESKLRALLEPEHDRQFVAIHVDSGDYAIAPTFREAKRTLLDRHSVDGRLVVMKIGPDPEIDPLAYRIIASEQKALPQK